MPTLHLIPPAVDSEGHGDEVLACSYAPDSKFILSGGWDGCLRLWSAKGGESLGKIEIAPKPVSACAISSDGTELVSGTLDGMLARWEASSHRQKSIFLAHTRPISSIAFSNDGQTMATASWDRNLILWGSDREARTLSGHGDIVAGCCFTPNAQAILSWSHDNTIRLWETSSGRTVNVFRDLGDRVTAGAISPDNRFALLGTRGQTVNLIDLVAFRTLGSISMAGEIRFCAFLLDGQSALAADATGKLTLHSVPDLKLLDSLDTGLAVQCGALAASGAQLALGCNDGRLHLAIVEGFDLDPLFIHMTQQKRRTATPLQRLFGKSTEIFVLQGSCPVCQAAFEYPGSQAQTLKCPGCRRPLRIGSVLPMPGAM